MAVRLVAPVMSGGLGSATRVATTGHYDVHLTGGRFLVTQQWDGSVVRGIFVAKFRALEEAEALEARYQVRHDAAEEPS